MSKTELTEFQWARALNESFNFIDEKRIRARTQPWQIIPKPKANRESLHEESLIEKV